MAGWQYVVAEIPTWIESRNQWLSRVVVTNGTEKIPLDIYSDGTEASVGGQVRTVTSKRDAVTLKPTNSLRVGVAVDVPTTVVAEPTKESLLLAAFYEDLNAHRQAERLAALPDDLRERAITLGATV